MLINPRTSHCCLLTSSVSPPEELSTDLCVSRTAKRGTGDTTRMCSAPAEAVPDRRLANNEEKKKR